MFVKSAKTTLCKLCVQLGSDRKFKLAKTKKRLFVRAKIPTNSLNIFHLGKRALLMFAQLCGYSIANYFAVLAGKRNPVKNLLALADNYALF